MYNLANIYVVYEDYYQALKNYEKALKVRPDYEVARIDYAIILSETFKTDEAIEQYKKVIANQTKFI
jgi:tetratricopeptide (TPR) repeat protein